MDNVKQHYMDRMTNYMSYRVYANMIKTNDTNTVQNLYDNLIQHVSDHPKWPSLLELFKTRIKIND